MIGARRSSLDSSRAVWRRMNYSEIGLKLLILRYAIIISKSIPAVCYIYTHTVIKKEMESEIEDRTDL